MKYAAEFIIKEYSKELFECLHTEVIDDERTKITFKASDEELRIHISCADPIAIRAASNSITRILGIFYN